MKCQIKSIGDTVVVSDKYQKREIVGVLDYTGQYPQPRLFQLSQDKCAMGDTIAVGDIVELDVNFRGRLWTGDDGVEKCFNSDEVWKITVLEKAGQPHATGEAF